MALDLVVGKSAHIKDNPKIVGAIEFENNPMISRLYKRFNTILFGYLANPFTDFTVDSSVLIDSKEELYRIIVNEELNEKEKNFIYKITAITCYALDSELPLHGVAD